MNIFHKLIKKGIKDYENQTIDYCVTFSAGNAIFLANGLC